jgi:hypothetical protein
MAGYASVAAAAAAALDYAGPVLLWVLVCAAKLKYAADSQGDFEAFKPCSFIDCQFSSSQPK